jgi:MFS family permease
MVSGASDDGPVSGARIGWSMVARGFLIQNVAIGCTFGAFGISVLAVEREFDTTRALASLGVALIMLAMSLISPPLAAAMNRFGLRRTFLAGLLLAGAGYFVAAAAPNIWVLLAAFALLIGPGATAAGTLPATVLASRWFTQRQGRAVGLVNMPLFVMLTPIVVIVILERYGVRSVYVALGLLQLLMLPVAAGIRDRPLEVPTVAGPPMSAAPAHTEARLSRGELMARREFWLVAVASAMLSAIGVTAVTHLAPLTLEKGCTPEQVTALVVLFGASSAAGSIVFGWLSDRISAALALSINASVMALAWCIILATSGMPLLVAAASFMGLAGGGHSAARNVLTGRLFGSENLGAALALAGLCAVPLAFGFPPLAGYLRDLTGDYRLSGIIIVLGSLGAAMSFCFLWATGRGRRVLDGRAAGGKR